MVLRDTGAEHFIEPVGIGGVVVVEVADVLAQLFVGFAPFGGVHEVGLVGYPVGCEVAVVVDLRLGTGASFGGNQDDTAAGTRTVNGSGRGIFQYGDGFNIRRGYGGHIATGDAVDDNHRSLVVLEGGDTAQTYLATARHIARTGGDGQTGNLALQQVGGIAGHPLVKTLFRHIGNGACYLAARLGTVTDSHYFAQIDDRGCQCYINRLPPVDGFFQSVVTDKGDLENGAVRIADGQGIFPVRIGNGTVCCTLFNHVPSDDRIAKLIKNFPRHTARLRKGSRHAKGHQHGK
ncbi:hypothetical protein Barb7_02011 [Bacteroidales bacterium Barb7]|nr:hypothetical protein Barb7_02011 [Bacteroidales bacterium Barb7]